MNASVVYKLTQGIGHCPCASVPNRYFSRPLQIKNTLRMVKRGLPYKNLLGGAGNFVQKLETLTGRVLSYWTT